jgi:RNA polymerase sigma-70 factor (ECF subfamily)
MSDSPPPPAFADLVDAHYEDLYRFALSLSRNVPEACDLVQETFVIWGRRGDSLRDASKARSWLFTTLYREFLRIRRKQKPQTQLEPETYEALLPPTESETARHLDGQLCLQALQQIDEIYRAPLTLYYLEDSSYKEIAAILDLPIGTVMSRLNRGKHRLREILERPPAPGSRSER